MKNKAKKQIKMVEKVNNQTKSEYRDRIKASYEIGEEYYKDIENTHKELRD